MTDLKVADVKRRAKKYGTEVLTSKERNLLALAQFSEARRQARVKRDSVMLDAMLKALVKKHGGAA